MKGLKSDLPKASQTSYVEIRPRYLGPKIHHNTSREVNINDVVWRTLTNVSNTLSLHPGRLPPVGRLFTVVTSINRPNVTLESTAECHPLDRHYAFALFAGQDL